MVSIVLSALIGAAAIAMPNDNWWHELRILGTTATIACASVCGLACGACLQRGHRVLPTAGLILTPIAALLMLVGIWGDISDDSYWKLTVSCCFYAVACAHLSMLFLARLAGAYRWTFLIAYQLILGLATLLTLGIAFELFDNHEPYWRLTGVVSVLVGAVTLLVPVFHFMSRSTIEALQAQADPLLVLDNEIAKLKGRLMELEDRRERLLDGAGRVKQEVPKENDPAMRRQT